MAGPFSELSGCSILSQTDTRIREGHPANGLTALYTATVHAQTIPGEMTTIEKLTVSVVLPRRSQQLPEIYIVVNQLM